MSSRLACCVGVVSRTRSQIIICKTLSVTAPGANQCSPWILLAMSIIGQALVSAPIRIVEGRRLSFGRSKRRFKDAKTPRNQLLCSTLPPMPNHGHNAMLLYRHIVSQAPVFRYDSKRQCSGVNKCPTQRVISLHAVGERHLKEGGRKRVQCYKHGRCH